VTAARAEGEKASKELGELKVELANANLLEASERTPLLAALEKVHVNQVYPTHRVFEVVLQKSTLLQIRRLILFYHKCKEQVDEFVWELTFAKRRNLREALERQPLLVALEKVHIKEVIAPYA